MIQSRFVIGVATLLIFSACGEAHVGYRLTAEEEAVQDLIDHEAPHAEVEVHQHSDGRQIEITLVNGPADSLAGMDVTSPPKTATRHAVRLARELTSSYEDMDAVREVKVGFAERFEDTGIEVGRSAYIRLDAEALQALGEEAPLPNGMVSP
jgi:hypothetical protein